MDEQQTGIAGGQQPQMAAQAQPAASVVDVALPSASALLKAAWQQYKDHAGLFVSIFLVPLVVGMVVGYLKTSVALDLPATAAVALSIVGAIVSVLGQIALFTAVSSPSGATFSSAYAAATKRFFPYLWLVIISGILSFGLTILFLIPGILFAIWFSMGAMVFIVEDERGMNALLKSKAYVEGRWWGTLGRLVFIGLVVGILTLVIVGVLSWILSLAGLATTAVVTGAAIIASLVSLVFTPLAYTYIFALYASLKGTKGAVEINRTSGHKAKFVVPAIIGLLLIPIFIGSLIAFAVSKGVQLPPLMELLNKTPYRLENSENLNLNNPDSASAPTLTLPPPAPVQ